MTGSVMRICVLGAGVIGLTTAYFLAKAGHRVTIVDRNGLPAQEASYANGGQLSYSYVAPLAAPAVLSSLPTYLLRRDSPLRFRLRADLDQLRWSINFLRACTGPSHRRHTAELTSLAYLSRDVLQELLVADEIDFDYSHQGKLVIHRDPKSFADATELAAYQRDLGADQQVMDADACLTLEPALEGLRGKFAGGIYTPSEDAGDCQKFCTALDDLMRDRYGVERLYHHRIGALKPDGRRIRAVLTDRGEIDSDLFVMTAGLTSRELMRGIGVHLPICALKGYSLTVPVSAGTVAPRISVTDSKHKIVYARLGGAVRIAAMVDIGASHGAIDHNRLSVFKRQVTESFPKLGDLEGALPWAGQRPATAQGKPIIGTTPFDNLLLNVGHGALGFTLACGSGKLIADLVQGGKTSIPVDPFRLGTVH
jgi:D-amino-acid dehydrogenase